MLTDVEVQHPSVYFGISLFLFLARLVATSCCEHGCSNLAAIVPECASVARLPCCTGEAAADPLDEECPTWARLRGDSAPPVVRATTLGLVSLGNVEALGVSLCSRAAGARRLT